LWEPLINAKWPGSSFLESSFCPFEQFYALFCGICAGAQVREMHFDFDRSNTNRATAFLMHICDKLKQILIFAALLKTGPDRQGAKARKLMFLLSGESCFRFNTPPDTHRPTYISF